MMGAAKHGATARAGPAGSRLRRPLQRRQVQPDQRAGGQNTWPAPPTSRAARARSTSSCWPRRLRLVDLPGYGFAKVSRTTAEKFQDLGRAYLRGRATLKRVYLLIDARHGLKKVDTEALDALDLAAVSYQIVLTKADKIKPHEVDKVTAETLKAIAKRPAAFPRVLVGRKRPACHLGRIRRPGHAGTGLRAEITTLGVVIGAAATGFLGWTCF
jgi:hypothetical protein